MEKPFDRFNRNASGNGVKALENLISAGVCPCQVKIGQQCTILQAVPNSDRIARKRLGAGAAGGSDRACFVHGLVQNSRNL
jgi:hypothetical protein